MKKIHENSLETLFYEALELSALGRAELLARLRVRDAKLEQKLRAMLDGVQNPTHPIFRFSWFERSSDGWDMLMESAPTLRPVISTPERVGNYEITRKLGQGGMGAVYEAFNHNLRRRVAIKVLHPTCAVDPTALSRFLDEARAVNIIKHPSIVDIHELGQHSEGVPYIVMEYLSGQPLSERLVWCGGRLGPVLLLFVRQIASALAAAHAQGIVHRDLKPDNVMIVNDSEMPTGERVKVVDFGVARFAAELGLSEDPAGLIVGTPVYMSPEQWRGDPVDGKADVYHIACQKGRVADEELVENNT